MLAVVSSNRFRVYETLVINLCRLPAFSSYVRIPPELWRHDSNIKPTGEDITSFPNLPMDYLQVLVSSFNVYLNAVGIFDLLITVSINK